MSKKLTPQTARSDRDLAQLRCEGRDRVRTTNCTFIVSGKAVSFVRWDPAPGETVTISKRELDVFIEWYEREQ